jgi:predicted Zn finger-like uncharacterized protein
MILTCPSCNTRYIVDPQQLGIIGRMVRCANCSHTWHAEPPMDMPKPVEPDEMMGDLPPDPAAGPVYGSFASDTPRPIPPGSNLPALSEPRPRAGLGWPLLLLVILVGAVGLVGGRNEVVRWWPPAARLYDTVGLPLDVPWEGLDLRNVTTTPQSDNGTLIVEGTVVNTSSKPRHIPELKAVMTSAAQQVLKDWTFPSGIQSLEPGESASFHQELPNVPVGGAFIAVTFSES